MIDSDNVLLLRPVVGLEFDRSRRAALGNTLEPSGLLAVTIWPLAPATAAEVPGLFTGVLKPALGTAGISVLATYATEHSENTFPGHRFARARTCSSGCRCSRTKRTTRGTFAPWTTPLPGAMLRRRLRHISAGLRKFSSCVRRNDGARNG